MTNDPELAALLAFDPVPRRIERSHGWSADNQRAFIHGLVETGNYRMAAHALGLTASGVYQLRKDAGSEDFARAWDEALALHRRRNPPPAPARQAKMAPRAPCAADARQPERGETDVPDHERRKILEEWIANYVIRLKLEREARVSGRVIAADFYVRQMMWSELLLSVEGKARNLLDIYKFNPDAGDIVYTSIMNPMSLLLDKVRRKFWAETDGLERPPLPELGYHTETVAFGLPSECQFQGIVDGPYVEAQARRRDEQAVLAKAQALWEEKSRADSAAWRARIEAVGGQPDLVKPMGKAKRGPGSILDGL